MKHRGNGFAATEYQFSSRFAEALTYYTVQEMRKGGDYQETLSRFGRGVIFLDLGVFAFTLDNLKRQLIECGNPAFIAQERKGLPELVFEIKKSIIHILSNQPEFTAEHKDVMIVSLTDGSKYQKTFQHQARP